MSITNPIRVLVLEEFRLRAADVDGAVARIVAASPHGTEPAIPLLTSIEDRRDVATLRAVHAGESTDSDAAQHAALDPLVSSWGLPKHYDPRITEHSQSPASSFRLAVTESGINAGGARSPASLSRSPGAPTPSGAPTPGAPTPSGAPTPEGGTTNRPVGLIWIGAPVGTHAGLMVLLGGYDDPGAVGRDPSGWPLPLSRELGVRIYENKAA